jgi:parallel beta-helix repeat protein
MLPVYAVTTPEIYLTSSTVSPDLKWNVTAWVKNIPADNATFAYQIKVFFNTSFLECLGASIPKWNETWIFAGLTTVSPVPAIDNSGGFVAVAVSILNGVSISGAGPFLLSEFEFQTKGELEGDPLSYLSVNNPDTYLLGDSLEVISPVIKAGGSIDFIAPNGIVNPQIDGASSKFDRASVQPPSERHVKWVVGLSDKVPNSHTNVATLAQELGGTIVDMISMGDKEVVVANLPLAQAYSFKSEVENAGLSRYVEPIHKLRAAMTPNDPIWQYQWGPKKIEADWAWNTTLGNTSVLVAVVDSGIDYYHPDLASNYNQTKDHDWVDNDEEPEDEFGHGTHVAGIIAAVINNGEGVAGVAQVQIMAERVLDSKGSGDDIIIAQGIKHAADEGAKIISMSIYGYSEYPPGVLRDAVEYAYNKGALLIACAGNHATRSRAYPAAYDEVIAVTATNETDGIPWWTNYGEWIELSAPGVNINSTMPTYHIPLNDPPYNKSLYYDDASGTSAAAPFVSGVAALIWSRYPNMTRDEVRYQLRFTTNDLGDVGFDNYLGWGRINAKKAVEETKPEHDLAIIDFEMPYVTLPNETVHVKTTVFNFGLQDEYNVTVELRINGTAVDDAQVSTLPSGATAAFNLSWTPVTTGEVLMESVVVSVTGETRTANNVASTRLSIRYPAVLRVPQNFTTIQSAIGEALPLDVIEVSNGTYYEHLLVNIPKISIIGQNRHTTIIDGSGSGIAVRIVEDEVTISGFTIQNSGPDDDSILLTSNGNNITDNKIRNGHEGIYLWDSSNNTIHANNITEMNDAPVYLESGSRNNISENDLSANYFGIFLFGGSAGNRVHKNRITSNLWDGIFGLGDINSIIFDNKITMNGNPWYEGGGISLVNSIGTRIEGNFIRENGKNGLFLAFMNNCTVYRNTIANNTSLEADVYDSSIRWSSRWNVTGSYWSDYDFTGADPDRNGIGNRPYNVTQDGSHQDKNPLMNPYLPGDVNNDGKVDGKDIAIIAKWYGWAVTADSPHWTKRADLNEDAVVNGGDMDIASANYGKTWRTYWGV